jgi:hypothetical protein
MKLLDAELVLMKGDDATEAERLDCAKFLRQQLRSYLPRVRVAKCADAEDRQRYRRFNLHMLDSASVMIQWAAERFPELAEDWADLERRAGALHQEVRNVRPDSTSEQFRRDLEAHAEELQRQADGVPNLTPPDAGSPE